MAPALAPKYPVYIPSKGRADKLVTARMFARDGVPFRVVVEPSQVEAYQAWKDRLLVLPEDGQGLVYSRNWIKDHSIAEGHARHWQFDDDVRQTYRTYRGNRLPIKSSIALALCEEFVDRYENVALASLNSEFFAPARYGMTTTPFPPFYLNARCYTCFLVLNSLPNRWRRRYNEDTDMSLQVLADGWCTVLFNAFMMSTPETMNSKGGQTDIYVDDGRLRMARQLESMWPGTVRVGRRHGRPQHIIKDSWQKFDTPLKLKPGVVIPQGNDEHGLKLTAVKTVTDPLLKKMLEEQ
jgi:TET-associated glycosyltransferase-like protein